MGNEDLDAVADALDRRSAHNVARSADLVRTIDRDLIEREEHLDAVEVSLARVRRITAAVEVGGGRLLPNEPTDDEPPAGPNVQA